MEPKAKYYRDLDGVLYKSVVVGYDLDSQEQYIALRELESGNVWMLPLVYLRKKKLIQGVPKFLYEELFDYVERGDRSNDAQYSRRDGRRDEPYPGYTDDPRLGQVQKFNRRYNGTSYNQRGRY